MKQLSAREEILNYLIQNQTTTIPELSEVIGISRPAVRFHLRKLIASRDVVKTTITTSPKAKGRPIHYYQLASHELPNNISQLMDWLLKYISAIQNESALTEFMEKFTSYILLIENIPQNTLGNIKPLLRFLTDHQYGPKWETRKDGPRIIFSRCPYLEIIKNHPELCIMDKLFIHQVLNLHVQMIQKIDPNQTKSSACIFQTYIT